MKTTRSMVSFDWAMKRLLRNKANFEILEGFLSEILRRKIIIKSIVESEGNKTDADDKSNKVDILVEADNRELVIIELQFDSEIDYFHRMLYGVSKALTEHISEGDPYSEVRKIYSVNIVYFTLGMGDDYIYHGITNFRGLHTNNELVLTPTQQKAYLKNVAGEIYPEYFIIMVRGFNNVAKNTLDEWVYYLKNNKINDDFKAQGLDKARKILNVDNLSEEEKKRYYRSIEERRIKESEINTALIEGEAIGLKKGEEIGLKKGEAIGEDKTLEQVVISSKLIGLSIEQTQSISKLSEQQITEILKRNNLL